MMRNGSKIAALFGLTLALAGCGGSSSMFNTSALDLFSTSSKATTGGNNAGGDNAATSHRYRMSRASRCAPAPRPC